MLRRLSSRRVYENPWMVVREDEVERGDGSRGIYGVVEKPDFALVVPIEDDAVWLVEQHRYPVDGRFWEFPQGSLGDGSDPLTTARAELAEETGLVAGRLRHIGHLYEAYGFSTQGFDVFVASELDQREPEREATEVDMRVACFSVAEFESMARHGRVKDAPTLAAWSLLRLAE